jgi:hypothetical protein
MIRSEIIKISSFFKFVKICICALQFFLSIDYVIKISDLLPITYYRDSLTRLGKAADDVIG